MECRAVGLFPSEQAAGGRLAGRDGKAPYGTKGAIKQHVVLFENVLKRGCNLQGKAMDMTTPIEGRGDSRVDRACRGGTNNRSPGLHLVCLSNIG